MLADMEVDKVADKVVNTKKKKKRGMQEEEKRVSNLVRGACKEKEGKRVPNLVRELVTGVG